MGEDVLVWLLSDEGDRERTRARSLVTALRVLRDDARAGGAESVGLGLERARGELDKLERAKGVQAFEGLIHAHLEAALPRDSFLDLGTPRLGYEEAWSLFLGMSSERTGPTAPPGPGESPLAVAERLCSAAAALGAPRAWMELWGARVLHVRSGAPAAEERWRELFERSRAEKRRLSIQAAFLAGLVAARLDRFDPRGARELFPGNEVLALVDGALRGLLAQAALFTGELALARELAGSTRSRAGRSSLAVVELRERVTPWLALLPGRAPAIGAEPVAARIDSRRVLGALFFGVFALSSEGELRSLLLDTAPGVRAEVERRLAEREGPWRSALEPEQRLFAGAEAVMQHRLEEGEAADVAPLRGALAGRAVRALALVPIQDDEGETAGWLRVESEHHLLPSRARLLAIAAAWRGEVLATHGDRAVARARDGASAPRGTALELDPLDPRLQVFQRLLEELALKASRRRAWLVEPGDRAPPGGFQVLAEHGGALGDWRERRGGGRALRRAVRTASAVSFGDPDPSLGIHGDSQSGLAAPFVVVGRARALIVIESTRRRDLLAADRERLERATRCLARSYRAAQFAAWHRATFEAELFWDPRASWFADLEPALRAAARSSAPVAIVGPSGAGKRTLARWMHFESGHPERAFTEGTFDLHSPPTEGTWVLELGLLPGAAQLELARALERGLAARLVLLSSTALAIALEQGRLERELARACERLAIELPVLADRRDEIPGLVRALARRCAREERLELPVFPDETLALLWRQAWAGNVRELGALVFKLVLCHPGTEIVPGLVIDLCRRLRLPLRERLPSRRPRALDLRLALATTAHLNGGWNRARAARYLGWDPDTLEARLSEMGIEEPRPAEEGERGPE